MAAELEKSVRIEESGKRETIYYYMTRKNLDDLPFNLISKSVIIRNIRKDELQKFVDLVNESLTHCPDPFIPMTLDFAEKWPLEQTLVAEVDGKIVGFLMFESRGKIGLPVQLGVLPKYRRMGVGTSLLLTLLRNFKNRGIEEVKMKVFKNNVPALTLYKKLKFKVYGVTIEE
ncbi:MAG: N-acetyltransferase family protein [Candidatus Freyarchaeota archaeon]